MKKLVYLSMMIAVGIAAASCKKVEAVPSESTEGSTFALNASIQQTKTTIDGLKVAWEEGDVLYLVTTDKTWGKPYNEDKTASTIAEYTYSSGTFASEATIDNGAYTFNALYDGSASQKSYHRGSSTTYNLQSIQDQDCLNPTGHLKNNDALVGTFNATVPMAEPALVSMSHIFAIMRVDVKNATGEDVELKSFKMSAAGATLAGIFTVNFANSPIDIAEKSGQSSYIKVNLSNGTVGAGDTLPVYFVMAPLSDYSGDVTFTVTDVNDLEYTKTVTLNNISFEAGSLNTTPYTIAKGVETSWTRVTTKNELIAGGTFIIGYEADANSGIIVPMANTGSATTSAAGFIYSGSTAEYGNSDTIDMSTVSETSKYEVTIVASTSVSGAICIKLGDNYLGNTNTKNNCKLFTKEAATTAFTPTVGKNDVFTLKIDANTGNKTNYTTLQYNSGSPRFAVYSATQNNVVIYKKVN